MPSSNKNTNISLAIDDHILTELKIEDEPKGLRFNANTNFISIKYVPFYKISEELETEQCILELIELHRITEMARKP